MGNNVLYPFRLQRKTDFFYPHEIKFLLALNATQKQPQNLRFSPFLSLRAPSEKTLLQSLFLKAFVRLRAERKASSAPFFSKEERFNGLSNPV